MVDTSRDERDYLSDILLYTRRARKHAQDLDFSQEKFNSSLLHQDAIVRCIEIIGEACSKVPPDKRNTLPQIPWSDIIRMRNYLIHAYFQINPDIVWDVVIEKIPPLIDTLESLALTTDAPTQ